MPDITIVDQRVMDPGIYTKAPMNVKIKTAAVSTVYTPATEDIRTYMMLGHFNRPYLRYQNGVGPDFSVDTNISIASNTEYNQACGGENPHCQHLHGEPYSEYILCTQTRSLGGISIKFRARVIHQLFPYKPFAPLHNKTATVSEYDSDAEMADEGVSVKQEVLSGGNRKIKQTEWTHVELQAHDEELKVYAKWEVNYASKYILSRCHTVKLFHSKNMSFGPFSLHF
jgi:hypothetical protein